MALLTACGGTISVTETPVAATQASALLPTSAPGGSGGPDSNVAAGSNPQQQPGSAIGALPTPTNGAGSVAAGTAVSAGNYNVCDLITAQQVQNVINAPVQAGKLTTDQTGVATCQFLGQNNNNSTSAGIALYQGPDQTQKAQDLINKGSKTPVPNLGDEAYAITNGVMVHVGDIYFSVGIAVGGNPRGTDAAISLAKLVLTSLPVRVSM